MSPQPTQHVETLVIGAGQAGLTTAYHLRRRGRGVLVVDGAERLGDSWRHQYDSLTLFTPAYADGLPGLPFPAQRWHFPTKDEMAVYLESYAVHHDLPVRLRTRVDRLARAAGGGFVATVGEERITCDNVVVATGTFGRTPYLPDLADDLAPGIRQLHSAEYRRPGDLPEGPVLVVGASHSGCDIAYELAATHEVTLCGPDNGRIPLRWGSAPMRLSYPLIRLVFAHVLTRRTPMGRKAMAHMRHHGAPMLRVTNSDLARAGVTRIPGKVVAASPGGRPVIDHGGTIEVSSVVWCTGYRQVYDWIDIPVIGEDGWPCEYRGVVAEVPGLYFCGLSFQYAFSSMEISGVDRDAEHVVRAITARTAPRAAPATV